MKRLVVYVISIDEDVAEKAFNNALSALSAIGVVNIDFKSVDVEPHDDYRGIVAGVEYEFILPEAAENRSASKGIQDFVASAIKAQTWKVASARVIIEQGIQN